LSLHRLGLLKPLSFVQWLVTNRCNFQCAFCEASAGAARPDELSTREGENLIDELAALRTRLLFSGGEPLMREDLPHLIRHAHGKGVPLGLVSNAYRVPSLWSQLREVPWFLFFTSLDGIPAYHDAIRAPGSFDRVLQSLELFARHQVPMLLVNTVVHQENLAMLPAVHQHLRASPVMRWHLTPAAAVGKNGNGKYRLDAAALAQLGRFVEGADRPDGLRVDFGESHSYLRPLLGMKGGKPFFCGAGLSRCSIPMSFYWDFYLPYLNWRFGQHAHARRQDEIVAAVQEGFVLHVLDQDRVVAAGACRLRGTTLTWLALGLAPDFADQLRRGAAGALYYELFRWARAHGVQTVNLLRARPHAHDGVSLHKRRFGARPVQDPWPHALLAIYSPTPPTTLPCAARDLLVEDGHGCLSRLADRLPM
jgi:MoaA/NifB/PqqE/SkfB family radical SAM enzyme